MSAVPTSSKRDMQMSNVMKVPAKRHKERNVKIIESFHGNRS